MSRQISLLSSIMSTLGLWVMIPPLAIGARAAVDSLRFISHLQSRIEDFPRQGAGTSETQGIGVSVTLPSHPAATFGKPASGAAGMHLQMFLPCRVAISVPRLSPFFPVL
jgi:hypothetical protein